MIRGSEPNKTSECQDSLHRREGTKCLWFISWGGGGEKRKFFSAVALPQKKREKSRPTRPGKRLSGTSKKGRGGSYNSRPAYDLRTVGFPQKFSWLQVGVLRPLSQDLRTHVDSPPQE